MVLKTIRTPESGIPRISARGLVLKQEKNMFKKSLLKTIVLLLAACLVLLIAVGCDNLIGPEGPAGADGATGATGETGPAGEDGGNIPGGIVFFNIPTGGLASESSLIQISFDPDRYVMDGDETTVSIPIADYFPSLGAGAYYSLTWHAPDVVPGSYFVYAWLDFNGDSLFDAADADCLTLYNPRNNLNIDATSINNPDATDIIPPNYTFWEDFAAQIDFEMNYAF